VDVVELTSASDELRDTIVREDVVFGMVKEKIY